MNCSVAVSAQGDQITFEIIARLASTLDVMDLELCQRAAKLVAPAISFKNCLTQPVVSIGTQPNPAAFSWGRFHAASVTRCKNSCLCAGGRKRKSRSMEKSRISGFPFSWWAPARKSAQIISRQ